MGHDNWDAVITVLCFAVLAVFTPLLAAHDLRTCLLPNRLTVPLIPLGLAAASAVLPLAVTWMLVIGCLFVALHSLLGVGMGDLKLVVGLTPFLVAVDSTAVTVALASAFLGQGLLALACVLDGASPDQSLPFGPAILTGAWTAIAIHAPVGY